MPAATTTTSRKSPAAKATDLAAKGKAKLADRRQQLAAKGFAAIALIQRKRREVTGDFLEVGRALQVLKTEGMADALGRRNFAEICEQDLDLSATKATELLALVERLDRGLALELGQERAGAILALVDATPEDDRPADIVKAKLKLPSGRSLDVAKASSRAILAAAREFRQAQAPTDGKPGRGRTTTAAERAALQQVEQRIKASKALAGVTLRLVAMGATKGADVVLRVPLAALRSLGRVLAK